MKLKENSGRLTSNDDLRFYRNRNLSNSHPLPPIKEKKEDGDRERSWKEKDNKQKVNERSIQDKIEDDEQYESVNHSKQCNEFDVVACLSLVPSRTNNITGVSPRSKFFTGRNNPEMYNPERMLFNQSILPPIQTISDRDTNMNSGQKNNMNYMISGQKNNFKSRVTSQKKHKIETEKSLQDLGEYDNIESRKKSPEKNKFEMEKTVLNFRESKVMSKECESMSEVNVLDIKTISLDNEVVSKSNSRDFTEKTISQEYEVIFKVCATNDATILRDNVHSVTETEKGGVLLDRKIISKEYEVISKPSALNEVTILNENVQNVTLTDKKGSIAKFFPPNSAIISKENEDNVKETENMGVKQDMKIILKEHEAIPKCNAQSGEKILKDNVQNTKEKGEKEVELEEKTISEKQASILKPIAPNAPTILKKIVQNTKEKEKKQVEPDKRTISEDHASISKPIAPNAPTIVQKNVQNTKEMDKKQAEHLYHWKSHDDRDTELSVTVYDDSSLKLSTTFFEENVEDYTDLELSGGLYLTQDSCDIPEFKTLVHFLHSEKARRRNGVCMDMDEVVSASFLEFNRCRAISAMFQL